MEKVQLCPQQGQVKRQGPEFLLHIEVQSRAAPGHSACASCRRAWLCCCVQAPSWSLCVESPGPQATWLLGARDHGDNRCVHPASAGHRERERRQKERLSSPPGAQVICSRSQELLDPPGRVLPGESACQRTGQVHHWVGKRE